MKFNSFNCNELVAADRRNKLEDLVRNHEPVAVFLQDARTEKNSELPPVQLRENLEAIPIDGTMRASSNLHKFSSDKGHTAVCIPTETILT